MTTYRPECGTHRGMMRHQNNGEALCGQCRESELRRRLEAERAPSHPSPVEPQRPAAALPDITDEQAQANWARLARAINAGGDDEDTA